MKVWKMGRSGRCDDVECEKVWMVRKVRSCGRRDGVEGL